MQVNKKSFTTSTLWSALDQFSFTGIQLLCTFILARFLTPEDYGIVGTLVIFTAIGSCIVNSGFSQALIREENVDNVDYSSVLYFNLALSLFLYLILFFCSPLIARFYHLPCLNEVCKVTFLVLPFNATFIVQQTILSKELQFKKLFFVTFLSSFLSSIIAVILGYIFRNYWALVFQNVLCYAFKSILLWLYSSWRPMLCFSILRIKRLFPFAENLLISGLIGSIFNNVYSLFIGHSFSSVDLGYYMQANRVKNAASSSLTSVVQNVSFPFLSKINANNDLDLKSSYRKIICITVMGVGFVMALLMGVSLDLFTLLMGSEQWRISGVCFLIIGFNGILYPLHSINLNVLMVKGEGKVLLYLEIFRRCINLVIIFLTLKLSLYWFLAGSVAYSIIVLFINMYYCGRPIYYSVKEQFADILPIFIKLSVIVLFMLCLTEFLPMNSVLLRMVTVSLSGCFLGFVLFKKDRYFAYLVSAVKSLM